MSETPDTHHADHADHADRTDVGDAFRQSIPVMLGYVPLGIVFGFLFVQAGGAPWLAVVSSILIYGGAVQYMMVPMLAAGASVASVAFATAVLNLRHIFYGLPILRKMPERGWRRWVLRLCAHRRDVFASEPLSGRRLQEEGPVALLFQPRLVDRGKPSRGRAGRCGKIELQAWTSCSRAFSRC